jgi:hypothetical protein
MKSVADLDICRSVTNAQGKTIATVNPVEIIQVSDPIALDWDPQHRD